MFMVTVNIEQQSATAYRMKDHIEESDVQIFLL